MIDIFAAPKTLPIEISFDYDRAYHRTASRMMARNLYIIIAAIVIIFGVWNSLAYPGDLIKRLTNFFLYSGGYAISIFIFLYVISYLNFRSSPAKNMRMVIQADDSGLKITSPISETTFSWKAVFKLIETRKGYLLYPQSRTAYYLPYANFRSEQEYDAFGALAKAHVGRYRKRGWL